MQLVPTAEGEIGSVATVHFDADASARSLATQPKLVVETVGTERAQIGDTVKLSITVSNPGSGMATGVVLEEHIPAGLQHPAGSELEYNVGNLRPGESRRLDLQLVAKRAGHDRQYTVGPRRRRFATASAASPWKWSRRSWTSP